MAVENFRYRQRERRTEHLCMPCEDLALEEFLLESARKRAAHEAALAAAPPAPPSEPWRARRKKKRPTPVAPAAEVPVKPIESPFQPLVTDVTESTRAEPAPEQSIEEPSRYANVGRSRSRAKLAAARENGRKGGRPPAWSQDVRAAAVGCLRRHAGTLAPQLGQELLRMASALEDGTLRLRTRQALPAKTVSSDASREHVLVTVTLRLKGRSKVGERRAEEEIVEKVLAPHHARRVDTWDYEVVLPCPCDEELDDVLSRKLPSAARAVAARRRCVLEYSARDLFGRTWMEVLPPQPPVQKKTMLKVTVDVFGRARVKARAEIERDVLSRFRELYAFNDDDVYRVWHKTEEELEHAVSGEMLAQMAAIVRARRCTMEYSIHLVDNPQRSWSGDLP